MGAMAATPARLAGEEGSPPLYRPRDARASPLYQLLETYYDNVKALWEDRFERKFGFWRGFVDEVVAPYLDCGTVEVGFARLKCDACGAEKLLTLSCKQRGLCPSCDAKRAAAFAAFLKDELLENVGHTLITFTLPKMLRVYFMRHRELLGDLARLAYETLKELMSEATGDENVRPGVVAVPQTFGSVVNPNPHVHCLVSRGVWDDLGQWTPVPYLDVHAAEKLWAHKVLRVLQSKGLLSDERIELLASFRHSGFSVDSSPTVWPVDSVGIERLGRYLMRCPVSLSRIHWTPGAQTLFYQGKPSHDELFSKPLEGETLDIFEFCGGSPFAGSPATSDSFEGARMRTIHRPRSHPDPRASQTRTSLFRSVCVKRACSARKTRSQTGAAIRKPLRRENR